MTHRTFLPGAVALALGWAPAASQAQTPGQSPSAHAVMETAAARYRGTPSLCADFVQTLSVPLLGEERSGRGRLCQAQPNLFAMRFAQPEGDAVVVDGTWVWVYYPSMDAMQVLRFPMAESPGGFDFHREFLEDFDAKYRLTLEGTEAVTGRSTYRIRLVPRTATAYAAAVVWVEAGGTLRKVQVEEENGSVRTVTLDRVELGVKPPAGWFTFTPPPGAQVVGG
jgi:outer membrane lipoprotein carrier protein